MTREQTDLFQTGTYTAKAALKCQDPQKIILTPISMMWCIWILGIIAVTSKLYRAPIFLRKKKTKYIRTSPKSLLDVVGQKCLV